MDTTKEFLARILSPTGNYVVTIIYTSGVAFNVAYDSLDDMVAGIAKQDKTPNTIYHAILTHRNNIELQANGREKVSRTKETAFMAKTLCFDLDVGPTKPYSTQKEAGGALKKVIGTLALPTPLIISSGKGLHVYWPLTSSINAAEWVELSTALRVALEENNLAIDASKIHDPTMILRPVGSHHKKDPNNWIEVTALNKGADTDVSFWRQLLTPWIGKAVSKSSTAASKNNKKPIVSKMLGVASVIKGDYPPIDLDKTASTCNQVKLLLDTAGERAEEPLWRLSLGIAKYSTDVNASVERLSGGHRDYSLDNSLAKLDGWTMPPPTCAAFDALNPSGCKGCKYAGQGKAPHTAAGDTTIEMPIVNNTDMDPRTFVLPESYEIYNNRITKLVTSMAKVKDSDGKIHEELTTERETVCRYIIVVLDRFTDTAHTETIITVGVMYPIQGWKTFEIPMSLLSSGGPELNKLLGNQQLFISSDEEIKRTRRYLMSYLEELQRRNATSYMYDKFGWQLDGTFLCGSTLLGDPQNRSFRLTGFTNKLSGYMKPCGTQANWRDATAIYNNRDAHGLQFFLLAGAGSILLEGSTINSVLMNMYSPGTGTGKTMTIHAINSIFGDPNALLLKSGDTDNSLFKTFGTLHNFPSCIDELHTMTPERRKPLVMQLTQGMERKRLNANSEMLEPVRWKAIVFAASNTDLHAELDLTMGTEAEKARIYQMTIPKSNTLGDIGAAASKLFFRNYGHVMPLLAQEILNMGGPTKVYEAAEAKFDTKYSLKFTGDERFIKAPFVAAFAAGMLLKKLDLVRFDYNDGMAAGFTGLRLSRLQTTNNTADAFDTLGQYLSETAKNTLEWVEHHAQNNNTKGIARMPVPETVSTRLEIIKTDTNPIAGGRLCINRLVFKRWMQKIGGDYTKFITDLVELEAKVEDNVRVSLYKGCDKSNPGQVHCLVIQLDHPRILSVLADSNVGAATTAPRLSVLQGGKS